MCDCAHLLAAPNTPLRGFVLGLVEHCLGHSYPPRELLQFMQVDDLAHRCAGLR
jgi:hypothetical protein